MEHFKSPSPGNLDGPYSFSGILSESDILKWREEFPILKKTIHVASCSQSAQSKRVRAAFETYLDNWQIAGMDWDSWLNEVNLAKAEFAKLIGADIDEISIGSCASDHCNSIASALDYGVRSKIVTTEIDFPTVGQIWLAHKRYGAKIDFVPVKNGMIDTSDYERYVDDNTLITSIAHVYYKNGFIQDLDSIVDICHRKGSIVMVDGYQGCGITPVDIHKQNIDIFFSGNLKYLLGTPGISFMYVNKKHISKFKPAHTGWLGQEDPFAFNVRVLEYASTGRRFDMGTPPVPNAYASRAGMQLINEVGVAAISERIDFLSSVAIQEAEKHSLDMISPRDISKKSAITSIQLNFNPKEMEDELRKRNIVASAREDVIRIAPHFYTTATDIIYVMEQVADIIQKRK